MTGNQAHRLLQTDTVPSPNGTDNVRGTVSPL